jgi:hypothetical protein
MIRLPKARAARYGEPMRTSVGIARTLGAWVMSVATLVAGCGEVAAVTDCPASARNVDGVCRPLCETTDTCVGDEICREGVCVPAPVGLLDASTTDAQSAPDAAPADALVDAGTPLDAEARPDVGPEPRDAEPTDALPSDLAPPRRDAGPRTLPDLNIANTGNVPSPLLVDEPFAVSVTVANRGDAPSSASVVALYINPAGQRRWTPASVLLGQTNLNAVAVGASAVTTVTARLPRSTVPGERMLVAVVDPANAVVEHDDDNNDAQVGVVDVVAFGAEPVTVDFGNVLAPCGEGNRSVSMVNRGTAVAVDVTSIRLSTPSTVFVVRGPMVPLSIGPNQQTSFVVSFLPTQTGAAVSTLEIHHNQPGSPILVPLRGNGTSGMVTDTFSAMTRVRRADVVLVVDPELGVIARDRLAMQAPAILSDLTQRGIEYRVAVRQGGNLAASRGFIGSPAFITPQAMAGAVDLATRIQSTGVALPTLNTGFDELDATLTAANPGLDPDAWLEFIVVTGQDDQTMTEASALAARVRSEKRAEGVARVSGIIPTMTCSAGNVTDTPRYRELVTVTQGAGASLCEADWSPVLSNIGGARLGVPFAYALTQAPDAASIQVTVGMTTGVPHTYDPGSNRVILSASALPQDTDPVSISYTAVCPP